MVHVASFFKKIIKKNEKLSVGIWEMGNFGEI